MKTTPAIVALAMLCLGAHAADVKVYLDSTNGTSSLTVYDSQSNELMRIRSDGRVGVGVSSPSYSFQVANTLRVDTDPASGHGVLITEIPEPEGPGWPVIASSAGLTVAALGDAELAGGYGNSEVKCQADGTIALEGSNIQFSVPNWDSGPYTGELVVQPPTTNYPGTKAIYHSGLLWRFEPIPQL